MTPEEQAKLAAQFGGKPASGGGDAELAAKFGGVPSPPISLAPGRPSSEAPGRFAGAVVENLNPVPLARALMNPGKTAKALFQQPGEAAGRAITALKGGQFGEAAKSAIGAVPLVGAPAEEIVRETTEGKIPEAAGHVAGMFLGPKILRGTGKAVGAAAPALAESALGIRALDRAYGRRPGLAAIEETRGVRPGTVSEQAQTRLGQIDTELENVINRSNAPVDLQGGIDPLQRARALAIARNQAKEPAQIQPMIEHLTTNRQTGLPLSRTQTPAGALALKRGFGSEFIHNWNPETMQGPKGAAAQSYHSQAEAIHRAVPESAALDRRASSLIPVAKRGESTERAPGLSQRIAGRIGAHTGALTGAGLGYYAGGAPGAIAGLIIPEILASPTSKMIAARGLHGSGKALQSPLLGKGFRVIPLARGAQKENNNGR